MKKKYAAYYRVSTDRQGKSGLGLEAQKQAIEQYCTVSDGTIEQDFIEVESGKKNNRPELEDAIRYCRKHKTVLLIAKLDRLSRNLHFITGLMESGIDFVAADNPHANKLMLHMLAAFAEHEREMIAERTRNALKAAAQRGVELGRYGKVLAQNNKHAANEFALSLSPVIKDIQSQGIQSLSAIAEELNQKGIRTYRDHLWHPQTVYNLLQRIEVLVR